MIQKKNSSFFFMSYLQKSDYIFSAFGILSNKVTQLLIQIALAKILAGSDYSLFYFYFAVITGLSAFIGEGLGMSASRILSLQQTTIDKPIQAVFNSALAGSILPAIFIAFYSFFISKYEITPLFLIFIMLAGAFISNSTTLQYMTVSLGHRGFLARMQIILSLFTLFLTLGSAHFYGWPTALYSIFSCVALGSIILIFKLCLEHPIKIFDTRTNFSSVLSGALPICSAMALGSPIHVLCISFLQASPNHATELGRYGISFTVYTLMSFLPGAMGQIVVPWLLSKGISSQSKSFDLLKKYYLMVTIPLLICCGLPFIFSFQSFLPRLDDIKACILLLAVAGLLGGLVALYAHYFNATHQSKSVLKATMLQSALYVGFTFAFVKTANWGAEGLALSILIATAAQLATLHFIKK